MGFFVQHNLLQAVSEAELQFYRLVLLCGGLNAGKTKALRRLSEHLKVPIINLNLLLSERLLQVDTEQRVIKVPEVFAELLHNQASPSSSPVILDNTELLFDAELKQNPLKLLQMNARNQTLIVSWNGSFDNSTRTLIYAEATHPEFKKYTDEDALIVPADAVIVA